LAGSVAADQVWERRKELTPAMSDGFATPLPSLSKPQPGKLGAVRGLVPGLLLCGAVTLAVTLLQVAEERLFGRAWLEALVLAILAPIRFT